MVVSVWRKVCFVVSTNGCVNAKCAFRLVVIVIFDAMVSLEVVQIAHTTRSRCEGRL